MICASPIRCDRLLHRVVRDHLQTFLAAMDDAGIRLPRNVQREFEAYLRCGILAHGFIRGECERCRRALLIAFSCKRRTVCPSCGAKRMALEAAHLLDRVLPEVPVRQWVLSMPFDLRFLLAGDRPLLSAVLRIFIDVISAHYRAVVQDAEAQCGAVAFIQRFDSTLGLNVHFHVLALDGAYVVEDGEPKFRESETPSSAEIAAVSAAVARRIKRLLVRREITGDDPSGADEDTGTVQGDLRFGWLLEDGEAVSAPPELMRVGASCADVGGFSVHAGVWVSARDRSGLERLIRYAARPPFADEQIEETGDGRIAFRLSKRRRNGATHAFMGPLPEVDALACPCGGRGRIRAVIEDPAVIRRILLHVGLPAVAPREASARAPP